MESKLYILVYVVARYDQLLVDSLRNIQNDTIPFKQVCIRYEATTDIPHKRLFLILHSTYHLETTSSPTTIHKERLQSYFTVS